MSRLKFYNSISLQIFLFIVFIAVVFLGMFAYMSITEHRRQLTDITAQMVHRDSDIIKRSIYFDMLENRKDDIYRIINTIGNEPSVERIRIYNDVGVISYSTDSTEIGQKIDLAAPTCRVCHSSKNPQTEADLGRRYRIFRSREGTRIMGMINPIYNQAQCAAPGCHAPPDQKKILGVLDLQVSLANVDRNIAANKRRIVLYAIAIFLFILLPSALFLQTMVYKPIRSLIKGTAEVAHGNLDYRIAPQGKNEIALLAYSFNRMTANLKRAQEELTAWSQTLEKRVEEKARELKRAQDYLIQVEKMASLGKLAATVAHELNNPLAGVLTYIKLFEKQIQKSELPDEKKRTIQESLDIVEEEIKRCGNIVSNLLVFSRAESARFEKKTLKDINSIIEKSLILLQPKIKDANVRLVKQYGYEGCPVECNEAQIKQAMVALLVNAIEAMPNGGTLTVSTHCLKAEDAVEIRVSDTGPGIPEDVLPHIFEPFFSTKQKEGAGAGLGLSVVYGIVQRHGGEIKVDTKPGAGTTFVIKIPKHSRSAEAPEVQYEGVEAAGL